MDNTKGNKQELTTEQYLSNSHIATYFQDAIEKLLEYKSENIKVDPTIYLHEYFKSVYDGTNTFFREYSYIYATPRNRSSFIRNFWSTFKHIGGDGDLLRINDYYALLCLLCRDFNYDIVEKTVNVVLMDDASDCVIALSDFIYAFQLQLYYDEFCDICLQLFENIHNSASNEVPLGETAWSDGTMSSKSEYISATQFYRYIKQELYVKTPNFSIPSEDIILNILNSFTKITFYGFMSSLGKNENLVSSIGALPTLSPLSALSKDL